MYVLILPPQPTGGTIRHRNRIRYLSAVSAPWFYDIRLRRCERDRHNICTFSRQVRFTGGEVALHRENMNERATIDGLVFLQNFLRWYTCCDILFQVLAFLFTLTALIMQLPSAGCTFLTYQFRSFLLCLVRDRSGVLTYIQLFNFNSCFHSLHTINKYTGCFSRLRMCSTSRPTSRFNKWSFKFATSLLEVHGQGLMSRCSSEWSDRRPQAGG